MRAPGSRGARGGPPVGGRAGGRAGPPERPLGLDRELRVLFLTDGACWGGAGLVRTGAKQASATAVFTAPDDEALIALLAEPVFT